MNNDQEIWKSVLDAAKKELPGPVVDSVLRHGRLSINGIVAQVIFKNEYLVDLVSFHVREFIEMTLREKTGDPLRLEMVYDKTEDKSRVSDGETYIVGQNKRIRVLTKTPVTAERLWDLIKSDYRRRYGGNYISAPKKTKTGGKVSEKAILDKLVAPEKDGGYGYSPGTIRYAWCRYLDNTTDVREIWKGVANFANMCNMFLRDAITGGPPPWILEEGPIYRCANPRCNGRILSKVIYNDDAEAPLVFPREICPIFINYHPCKGRYFRKDHWERLIEPKFNAIEKKKVEIAAEKAKNEQKSKLAPDTRKAMVSAGFTPLADVLPSFPDVTEPEIDLDAVKFPDEDDDPGGIAEFK